MGKVFSIYDSKVKAYQTPFTFQNSAQAVRSFEVTVNDPKTDFHRWPADYFLFEIASYDDQTGKFVNLDTPFSHGSALSFKKDKEVQDV